LSAVKKNFAVRILGWLGYIFSSLFLGLIIFLARPSLLTFTMLFSRNAYLPRFVDKVYLIVFGMVWLVSWIYLEAYYSNAVKQHRLWPYFLKMTGIELILLFAALILSMFYTTAGVFWPGVALVSLALVVGLLLLRYSKRLLSAAKPDSIQQAHDINSLRGA
jgi:hypothetical protein